MKVCTEKDCNKPAAFMYRWPWGDEGFCCVEHAPIVEQLARNLNAQIVLSPIPPEPEPRPDELEYENTIVSLRLQLSEADQRKLEIQQQMLALRGRIQPLERELEAALRDVSSLSDRLKLREQNQLELHTRLERAREILSQAGLLEMLEPQPPTEPTTIVEGQHA